MAHVLYGPTAIVAVAFATTAVHRELHNPWWLDYLIAVNVVAFSFYVYDKIVAQLLDKMAITFLPVRVPEHILVWFLAFPGGSLGAYAAMYLAEHKTGPGASDFRRNLAKAVFAQVAVAAVLVRGVQIPSTQVNGFVEGAAGSIVDTVGVALAAAKTLR